MIVNSDGSFVVESKEEVERFLAALEELMNETSREPQAKAKVLNAEETREFIKRVKERYCESITPT